MLEHENNLDDDPLWRRGRRMSVREVMTWITVISIALSVPAWFGLPLLPIVFYGTLGSLIWRLSKAMPLNLAALIAVVVAVSVTSLCTLILPEL
jgi:hypothetical protein